MATDPAKRMEVFSEQLKKLNEALEAMKQFGVSEDVLKAYICHKMKISEKKAEKIMQTYEDFYKNFLRENIVSALEFKKGEAATETNKVPYNDSKGEVGEARQSPPYNDSRGKTKLNPWDIQIK